MRVQWEMKSRIGSMYLVASPHGLRGLVWKKQNVPMVESLMAARREHEILRETIRQVEEYLAGLRTDFDLPLDPVGTEFQRSVWNVLSTIPYGETRSYKDVARTLRKDSAMRAVGNANGRNPLSIIVPCHRVIETGGGLGGYAGGLATKTALLALEQQRRG